MEDTNLTLEKAAFESTGKNLLKESSDGKESREDSNHPLNQFFGGVNGKELVLLFEREIGVEA